MLRMSAALAAFALLSFGAVAQTTINEASPSTKSNSPDANKSGARDHTSLTKPQNSISNSDDMCAQWHLAPAALTTCREQWATARTDQERQKIRTRYEAVRTDDPKAAHENTGRETTNSATTNNAPIR